MRGQIDTSPLHYRLRQRRGWTSCFSPSTGRLDLPTIRFAVLGGQRFEQRFGHGRSTLIGCTNKQHRTRRLITHDLVLLWDGSSVASGEAGAPAESRSPL